MYRSTTTIVLAVSILSLAVACGDDAGGDVDAKVINLFDAPIPDAAVPDAFVCVETDTIKNCGSGMAGCVDITSNNQHCGGCGMACSSNGQACVAGGAGGDAGVAHCECPPDDFIPANPIGTGQILNQAGLYIALYGFPSAGVINVITAIYDPGSTPIDTDIDLSQQSGFSLPLIGAGYNVNVNTMEIQTPYRATSGILRVSFACPTGFAATLTGATFEEIEDLTNPVPVSGGCTTSAASVTFTVGDCTSTADAGVPVVDAMP